MSDDDRQTWRVVTDVTTREVIVWPYGPRWTCGVGRPEGYATPRAAVTTSALEAGLAVHEVRAPGELTTTEAIALAVERTAR